MFFVSENIIYLNNSLLLKVEDKLYSLSCYHWSCDARVNLILLRHGRN